MDGVDFVDVMDRVDSSNPVCSVHFVHSPRFLVPSPKNFFPLPSGRLTLSVSRRSETPREPVEVTTTDLIQSDLAMEIFHLRILSKIDRRTTACRITAERQEDQVVVRGFSMFPQTDAFIRETATKTFAPDPVRFELRVLTRDYPLAFHEVTVHAAPFYKDPVVSKEDLQTEALYGTILRTFFERDGYVFAQHPDGYVGYVPAGTLRPADQTRYLRWKNGDYAILREQVVLESADAPDGRIVIPPAARLMLEEDGSVVLPTGGTVRLADHQFTAVRRDDGSFARTLDSHAGIFSDTPYLWGGKTQAGIDCSGFVQSLMLQEGIFLPRDASMQAYVGEIVGYLPDYEDLLPGDMVFFMNNNAHVYHIGIYLGNRTYLHSSGSQNIVRSSLDPGDPHYSERYGGTFVFGRRLRP